MKSLAEKLAEEHLFLRVDLYEINENVYFSELTFSPTSGYIPIQPPEYDEQVGRLLVLPNK